MKYLRFIHYCRNQRSWNLRCHMYVFSCCKSWYLIRVAGNGVSPFPPDCGQSWLLCCKDDQHGIQFIISIKKLYLTKIQQLRVYPFGRTLIQYKNRLSVAIQWRRFWLAIPYRYSTAYEGLGTMQTFLSRLICNAVASFAPLCL